MPIFNIGNYKKCEPYFYKLMFENGDDLLKISEVTGVKYQSVSKYFERYYKKLIKDRKNENKPDPF